MSTLIANVQLSDLLKALASGKALKACEVFNGEPSDITYVGTFIPRNPYDSVVADRIRTQSEYLGMSSNSIYPSEHLTETTPSEIKHEKYTALAKGRAILAEKRAKAKLVAVAVS